MRAHTHHIARTGMLALTCTVTSSRDGTCALKVDEVLTMGSIRDSLPCEGTYRTYSHTIGTTHHTTHPSAYDSARHRRVRSPQCELLFTHA
jgi:hypothetical protein